MVAGQERRGALLRGLAQAPKNRRALGTLPLGQADVAAAGHQVAYMQDILACQRTTRDGPGSTTRAGWRR